MMEPIVKSTSLLGPIFSPKMSLFISNFPSVSKIFFKFAYEKSNEISESTCDINKGESS